MVDPVARFHLGNGARLERINWMGDLSEKGLAESYGVMVNYLYDLAEIERNHEAFANQGVVVASSAVKKLLPSAKARRRRPRCRRRASERRYAESPAPNDGDFAHGDGGFGQARSIHPSSESWHAARGGCDVRRNSSGEGQAGHGGRRSPR